MHTAFPSAASCIQKESYLASLGSLGVLVASEGTEGWAAPNIHFKLVQRNEKGGTRPASANTQHRRTADLSPTAAAAQTATTTTIAAAAAKPFSKGYTYTTTPYLQNINI